MSRLVALISPPVTPPRTPSLILVVPIVASPAPVIVPHIAATMDASHFNEAWLQDLNGSDSYNPDSSAHGFIKDDEFLIVPHGADGAFFETNYGGGAVVVLANHCTAA